ENDVNLVKSYLEGNHVKATFDEVQIKTILNTDAEKEALVAGIREHLGQAKAGDTAFFYFSGHGIREKSTIKTFSQDEIDGALGGVVCSDVLARKTPDLTVLTDKEFRYLIATAFPTERPHVVFVFDCCHSGDHTRSLFGSQQGGSTTTSRQIERETMPAREWSGFIFSEDEAIKQKVKAEADLEATLPMADHVMMAACRDVELAWEGGGQGAFTRALIQVLNQHAGRISYHELQTRVLNRMRFDFKKDKEGQDKRQTPQLNLFAPKASDRYRNFLTNTPNDRPSYGVIEFNDTEREIRLSLGAMHGMPLDSGSWPKVSVYPAGDQSRAHSFTIKEIFPTYSLLDEPSDGFRREPDAAYRGEVAGLGIPALNIFLAGDEQGKTFAKQNLDLYLKELKSAPFSMVDTEEEADYVVAAKDKNWYLTAPHDHSKPLVQPFSYGDNPGAAGEILARELDHVAQWNFLKDVNYSQQLMPDSLRGQTTMYPVELRIFEFDPASQTEDRIHPKGNTFNFELTEAVPERWVRFELINHADQALQTSLIYMTHTFAFMASEQQGVMQQLHPVLQKGDMLSSKGHPKGPDGKAYIRLHSGSYVEDFNWPGSNFFLKLIVSATPFEVSPFHLKSLPAPSKAPREVSKFFDFGGGGEEAPLPKVKWELRTFELYISNPKYRP
ncbi:MAG: caspase family protein, partial [Bacteroidota bacterium]